MQLRNILLIIMITFFAIYFGAVIALSIGEVYRAHISITTFSEFEHRIEREFLGADISDQPNVIMVTQQELEGYPIILELIAIAEKKEPPKNTTGYVYLTFEDLESIIELLAAKLALQEGGQASDYIRINDDEEDGIYYYKFGTEFFYIDDQLYSIDDHYPIEDFEKIRFTIRTTSENYWIKDFPKAHLTSDEAHSIPKLQEALDEIGKYYEDIQERKGVLESEYFKYYDWAVSMKIIDPNDYKYTQNTYIQFNDKLYQLGFYGI